MASTYLVASLLFLSASPNHALNDGLARTPPRGWRSWNCFPCDGGPESILTQDHVRAQMLAAVNKSRLVNGRPTSLAELGFNYISMDDGWQHCNCSAPKVEDPSMPVCPDCSAGGCSFHDQATGQPMIKPDRFPDMKSMVDFGHSLGLKVGTYLNNCICTEKGPQHYEQDVAWMTALGFDEVKIDGCSSSHNVSRYAMLLNASGRPVRIENCHNAWPDFWTGECPMHMYRSGGDINPNIGDILNEAYGTVDFVDLKHTRSFPGCWAYPDMSEVGNFQEGPNQLDQEQMHWGLWCIVSSPLILGFDMRDDAKMERVWPIITNMEALAVSESWAGHPGTLIRSYPASPSLTMQVIQGPCDGNPATHGWRFDSGRLIAPNPSGRPGLQCLNTPQEVSAPPPTTYYSDGDAGLMLGNCTEKANFKWELVGNQLRYSQQGGPSCLGAVPLNFDNTRDFFTRQAAALKMQDCPQAEGAPSQTSWVLTDNGELRSAAGRCLQAAPHWGVQLWAKPLNTSSVAVLLINSLDVQQHFQFPVADVPQQFHGSLSATDGPDFVCHPGHCSAWDVWAHHRFEVTSDHLTVNLNPFASAFYILGAEDAGAVESTPTEPRDSSIVLTV